MQEKKHFILCEYLIVLLKHQNVTKMGVSISTSWAVDFGLD